MSRIRLFAAIAAIVAGAAMTVAVAATTASAAACAPAWSSSAVYTAGGTAAHNGRNWSAQWWTQNETPGSAAVWADQGACGGTNAPGGCDYPNWVAGQFYAAGNIVRYTDGKFYIAEHDNPGYDPVISTWYWDPYTGCGTTNPPNPGGFVVTEAQFNQMFPSRNAFYTYRGLTDALSAYPGFARTGSDTVKKQEAAAFLANVNHETGGLVHIVEQNQANYPHYCDTSQPYGCPAGQAAYYGRGPIQLSWNFNYKAAGDALGLPLLTNPWLVQNDAAVAWKTGLWYWNTQRGPGTMTPHDAMVNGRGFGETIRSINGALECNGRNPAQVQSRVNAYQRFTGILGVTPGNNLSC
ncbi:glycoside hydrolase family 19 protein [Saccharothrix obliqua]|uniref:glycoside hydrolase family 19 protein n=1 Tax=Saccharothrix obliqua TaxID=2861747 RepID=UPI001C5F1441|nr:glycoside hydrolase family 19 protein [Saccharothrix obliqua]MBW4718707.1 chitinase [Saccharothrix obliqua]